MQPGGSNVLVEDDVRYVNDELYEDVYQFLGENLEWTGEGGHEPEAEAAVVREARLLDQRRYEEWLGLYLPQCVYWVPSRVKVGDPREEPAIHFDDHRRMADRVALIRTGFLHAQTPPSITCRLVSSLESRTRAENTYDVSSALLIDAYRNERHVQYLGRQFHRIMRVDSRTAIRYRVLLLNDREGSQGNITFIL